MADYRKLEVYQLANAFSDRIAIVVGRLPRSMDDKADQLRRAADSIHENIAEGCGLGTDKQLLKYLRMALGSTNECEDELHTLNRRGLLLEAEVDLLEIARRLCAMLAKFIQRVESDIARADQKPKRHQRQPAGRGPRADAESQGPQPSG